MTVMFYLFAHVVSVHKPHGCCGGNRADVSVKLCAALRPLARRLAAVLAEAEDGQHVSPLLPPQRVSFVQRRELAADGDGDSQTVVSCDPV